MYHMSAECGVWSEESGVWSLESRVWDFRITTPDSALQTPPSYLPHLCYNPRATPSGLSSPGSENPLNQDVTSCPRCARRTPAARGECIYCGEQLPFASITSAPPQRNIDITDHAFNTVLEPAPARINES